MPTCHDCNREGLRGYTQSDDKTWHCSNADQCAKRVAKAARAAVADRCVDCVAEGLDPKGTRVLATKDDGSRQPGPRCVTHWRGRKKQVSAIAHGKRIEANFGLTSEQYWAIYEAQRGKCFGCQWATGKTKRLAVDHDHELALEHGHDPKMGCALCVRSLLCGPCNQILGRLGVEALCRLIQVLTDPPARKILATLTGEPIVIPPTGVEVDDAMDPALDAPVDAGDFWAAEADRVVNVEDNFWFNSVES